MAHTLSAQYIYTFQVQGDTALSVQYKDHSLVLCPQTSRGMSLGTDGSDVFASLIFLACIYDIFAWSRKEERKFAGCRMHDCFLLSFQMPRAYSKLLFSEKADQLRVLSNILLIW